MRRFVVGTAGHVDHGKTTLVRALTGTSTPDRLAEENGAAASASSSGFAPWTARGGSRRPPSSTCPEGTGGSSTP